MQQDINESTSSSTSRALRASCILGLKYPPTFPILFLFSSFSSVCSLSMTRHLLDLFIELIVTLSWSRNLFDLQKHDVALFVVLIFFYMSIISNYHIKMRFFLTCRKIHVNCLSTFNIVFIDVYNFKLLAKIKNSTKKRMLLRFNFLSFDC